MVFKGKGCDGAGLGLELAQTPGAGEEFPPVPAVLVRAMRSRLRTEEQQGRLKAIEALSYPEGQTAFRDSSTTLLRVASALASAGTRAARVAQAYCRLAFVASMFGSLGLAASASQLVGEELIGASNLPRFLHDPVAGRVGSL